LTLSLTYTYWPYQQAEATTSMRATLRSATPRRVRGSGRLGYACYPSNAILETGNRVFSHTHMVREAVCYVRCERSRAMQKKTTINNGHLIVKAE
jgi:hypothetical protein